jgi:hypothetical protein
MESTIIEEKPTYYTPSDVVFLCRRFGARSLVTSSRPPGAPWVLYDEPRHGKGYMAADLDEWRAHTGQ